MSKLPPHRRDQLLHDTYTDAGASALPSRMAARIRRIRRIRQTATIGGVAALALAAFFARSQPADVPQKRPANIATKTTPPSSSIPLATDAELLAHLAHESVIIFTLADGQRQIVWLSGTPGI